MLKTLEHSASLGSPPAFDILPFAGRRRLQGLDVLCFAGRISLQALNVLNFTGRVLLEALNFLNFTCRASLRLSRGRHRTRSTTN